MEISGSFKHFWSDLSDPFRGSSPSPDIRGEHKWDKGRELCVWKVKGQAENTGALLLGKAIESKVRQVHLLEAVCEGGPGVSRGEAKQQPAVTGLAACLLPPPFQPQRHKNSLPPVVKNELGWSDSYVWDLNNLF